MTRNSGVPPGAIDRAALVRSTASVADRRGDQPNSRVEKHLSCTTHSGCRSISSKTYVHDFEVWSLTNPVSIARWRSSAREPSFLERCAQRRGESSLFEARAIVQDRAGILLWDEVARCAHRSNRHKARRGERNSKPGQKQKLCSTALRSIPNRAAKWPIPAGSTIIPARWKLPKCAAPTTPSPD